MLCFSTLKMEQVLGGEGKEQEIERNNKSSTLLNPVSPNIFALGTLFSQITFTISQKFQETSLGQGALSDSFVVKMS